MAQRLVANALLLAYPLLVHAAIVTQSLALSFAALIVLGANMLAPWLARDRVWPWLALAGVIAASFAFVRIGESRLFLYAAPVLVPLALLWFFGRTLLPGQIPFITRIATAIRGPLPEPLYIYTRHVTQLWVLAFAAMALANLLLAMLAPPFVWSLFTNFINYLLVGVLFVAEWLYRCWAMRDYESMTWRQYMQAMLRLDYRKLMV